MPQESITTQWETGGRARCPIHFRAPLWMIEGGNPISVKRKPAGWVAPGFGDLHNHGRSPLQEGGGEGTLAKPIGKHNVKKTTMRIYHLPKQGKS